MSGGGSALLVAPAKGITLQGKQRAIDLLMKAGATIHELNAVRKHLSAVKGGRLARIACPATIVTLLISDVIDDRLDVIASGPTAPDRTTFAEALAAIRKYGLHPSMPPEVLSFLERGAAGGEEETAREDDPCFARTQTIIAAGLGQAIDAAQEKVRALGMRTEIVSRELQGEARAAARFLAQKAIEVRSRLTAGERLCLLSGGETTVTVKGTGTGGRNQELALAFALEIAGEKGIALLSAGTDGTDGPTDAAGAMVDCETVRRAAEQGLFAGDYLANNDSYGFFRRYDAVTGDHAHITTGPTGTNVMDIQIIMVEQIALRDDVQ
jgi:glycerate-2-kinase